MPRVTNRQREQWHAENGEAIEWLDTEMNRPSMFPDEPAPDHVLVEVWNRYLGASWLDVTDTATLNRAYVTAMTAADEPAGRDNAWWVPNGVYRLSVHRMEHDGDHWDHYDYQVYLVTRGRLVGQRIVKYRRESSDRFRSGYEGFATLTHGGGMRLWTRYANDTDAEYVRTFVEVLDRYNGPEMMPEMLDRDQSFIAWVVTRTGTEYQLRFERQCVYCNNLLRTEEQILSGFCNTHRYDEPGGSVHRVSRSAVVGRVSRIVRSRPRVTVLGAHEIPDMPVRRTSLPMCEVTGREIQ